jgi:hypothetical protein
MERLQNDRDRIQYMYNGLEETHRHCLNVSSYELRQEILQLKE